MSQSMRDQVNSLQHFQQHSRLHFIGQWKTKMEDEFRELFAAHPEWNHGTLEQQRAFIHIDMDAFFCSVQLAKPENAHLRSQPVGIAAGKFNSDISSCNYVARTFGIRAGMYVNAAKVRCPDLVTLGYDLEGCERVAKTLYRIVFESFPHNVKMSLEVYSIDEVMLAADTTDYAVLQSFCETVRRELFAATGCTASCGIGPNIMLARVATDRAKPNGIRVVDPKDVPSIMISLPLDYIHGAGENTMEKICGALRERKYISEDTDADDVTCGTVQQLKLEELQQILGKKQGETFYHRARGEDSRVVTRTGDPDDQRYLGKRVPNSVGCTMNYAVRPQSAADVANVLRQLLDDVCGKLRRANAVAQGMRVTLLERHPLHPKETLKFMGRGKCVEVHLSLKLPHPMAAEEAELMFNELDRAVRPLLVTSRSISDEERAAQLGLTTGAEDQNIWTVTLPALRDIVIEDVRGMTVQATGLRVKGEAPIVRQRTTGQQLSLAAAFFNAKRPRSDEAVTVVESTPAARLSDARGSDVPTAAATNAAVCAVAASSAEQLYALVSRSWRGKALEECIAAWQRGCEAACRQLDYPLVKAYLRGALVKLAESAATDHAAKCFETLVDFANTRLPAPLDFD
ncbi:putative DNA damage repair protein [Leptomonas pyrrhocoris]|uniref:Putative DNA damage repair protein n=1 Tax=Leptomonas pyrrhocoris TaxID=157538 RepID=A0A0M9G0Q8_LEPPY|nr:putative DNA damage repair protein [Leptomonas pyrrhocoris]XP_015658258.1 putative DNA damage repair protein [Leptomonas pyrrhocoris]KPA79818.1 putative DNA damage repair protein [Leptomonas pyrrhocoris]KPA79819.1 putative DNA damage repair protein [Leptomonas pyrrhocoris]|eukprot:XP_015658257.1 putative DNA damage repair protein [Leptomonas pyrrhocoris]